VFLLNVTGKCSTWESGRRVGCGHTSMHPGEPAEFEPMVELPPTPTPSDIAGYRTNERPGGFVCGCHPALSSTGGVESWSTVGADAVFRWVSGGGAAFAGAVKSVVLDCRLKCFHYCFRVFFSFFAKKICSPAHLLTRKSALYCSSRQNISAPIFKNHESIAPNPPVPSIAMRPGPHRRPLQVPAAPSGLETDVPL